MHSARRASGILLHVTSLPSDFGVGDLGPESYRFVDLLAEHNQRYWSILPLNPTRPQQGNSPYKAASAFAGNPLLISPEMLVDAGLLAKEQLKTTDVGSADKVGYRQVEKEKHAMLLKACRNRASAAKSTMSSDYGFERFISEQADWLNDYALYNVLREKSGKPWHIWPRSIRDREKSALAEKEQSLKASIEKEKLVQFFFFSQWRALKLHCKKRNVQIIGDLSYYVDFDSADAWAHPELFSINSRKQPKYVGGVPPDYFSRTGQLWGTPAYDWKQLAKTGFDWWLNRIRHNLKLVDVLRLDHFRGFVAYWRVPARAKTAAGGRWIRVPSQRFLGAVERSFPTLPFIAEDLGAITEPVRNAMRLLGVPGMRVLLFAFDGSADNPHLPKNYPTNSVVYTGTHDTNTVKGWFAEEASSKQNEQVSNCIGRKVSSREISWEFIRVAMASKANLCLIPMQDALSLGSEARMNHPARSRGNWRWRATKHQLSSDVWGRLGELTREEGGSG